MAVGRRSRKRRPFSVGRIEGDYSGSDCEGLGRGGKIENWFFVFLLFFSPSPFPVF